MLHRAIVDSQPHSGTYLAAALRLLQRANAMGEWERTLVITDEQSHDGVGHPLGRGYVMNVASYQKALDPTGKEWTTISGWSPAVLRYVAEAERIAA
jgi:hypothetical protein